MFVIVFTDYHGHGDGDCIIGPFNSLQTAQVYMDDAADRMETQASYPLVRTSESDYNIELTDEDETGETGGNWHIEELVKPSKG